MSRSAGLGVFECPVRPAYHCDLASYRVSAEHRALDALFLEEPRDIRRHVIKGHAAAMAAVTVVTQVNENDSSRLANLFAVCVELARP